MTRIILIALLLVILRLAVKNFTRQLKGAVLGEPGVRPVPRPRTEAVETLVPCAACGAYVPASRSLKSGAGRGDGGAVYCSEECRRRGA